VSARAVLTLPLLCLLLACGDQEMANMPRYEALEPSDQFPDGTSALWPVPGTVARDADLSQVPETVPLDVDLALLRRGRERYEIFCAPCHSRSGDGDGMIVSRGFPRPPTYHQPALRAATDRHFYDVITNGYGAMYSYAARVPPADRWAIVAYIRTLQYSRHAPADELPEELKSALEGAKS
jgi:mono/diheme cytochrome c family protein